MSSVKLPWDQGHIVASHGWRLHARSPEQFHLFQTFLAVYCTVFYIVFDTHMGETAKSEK